MLAALVLAAAGVELLSAAVGRHVDVWTHVPLPETHEMRVLALIAILAASLALLALLARGRAAPLRASVDGGSLQLPPSTLARFLAARLAGHPDVVVARSSFTETDGRLVADLWIALRPLAPADSVVPILRHTATTALCGELGLAAEVRGLRVKVLRVRDLPRFLPQ